MRPATPRQLKALLLPHQQGTDPVRRAPRNLLAESPALVGRTHRARQSHWYCTPAGLAEAAASGELASPVGRTTGKRVAVGETGETVEPQSTRTVDDRLSTSCSPRTGPRDRPGGRDHRPSRL
ncbi:hypothetical protein [Streptomyces bikiniensis]|uniref:hypothetical protein n=1 Tax=Streptomyces bikiniensis TaxID=1896 RepID=UPI000AEFFD31|nr:hypothetical protein [Streptomyces bikiniensis]